MFKHVLDRHGLWDEVRCTPPRDEFGPLVNLGLLQVMDWAGEDVVRDFIQQASKKDLATFIAFLAPIGNDFVCFQTVIREYGSLVKLLDL